MLIVLNNKSNFNKKGYQEYLCHLKRIDFSNHTVVLCPSSPYFILTESDEIYLGSQNVSKNSYGSHTGEVSAEQLKSLGVSYCLVGHSERRYEEQESIEDINKKIMCLLKNDINPILCIGETASEREDNKTVERINNELTKIIESIPQEYLKKIIIAYEPIWAIGSGIIPTAEQINGSIQTIKKLLPGNKVLYGGSLNEKNIATLLNIEIDGYLVGNLSLNPEKLNEFILNKNIVN